MRYAGAPAADRGIAGTIAATVDIDFPQPGATRALTVGLQPANTGTRLLEEWAMVG